MGVIKDQRRQVMVIEDGGPGGIVSGCGFAIGCGNKDGGNGMLSGIAPWIRIGVQLPQQPHRQAGFLQGLAAGRLFQGFAVVDKPPGRAQPWGGFFLSMRTMPPRVSMMISTVGTGLE